MDLPANPLDQVKRAKLANARDRRLDPGEYDRLKVALHRPATHWSRPW